MLWCRRAVVGGGGPSLCSPASLLLAFPLQTSLLPDYTLRVTVTHGWWLSPGREDTSKPILTPGLKIHPT